MEVFFAMYVLGSLALVGAFLYVRAAGDRDARVERAESLQRAMRPFQAVAAGLLLVAVVLVCLMAVWMLDLMFSVWR